MEQTQIVEAAKQVVTNPLFQIGAALVIVKLIPNGLLAKIPIIGSTVQMFVNAWANKKLSDFDFQRDVMEREADRVVRANEQEIQNGRIDQSSAKAQGTQEMMRLFNINQLEASKLIENSVNKLPKVGKLLVAEIGSKLEEQQRD